MKTTLTTLFLIFVVCACNKKTPSRPATLPDNVVTDKPIVIKNGQALVLMMEGDQNLKIGVGVTDGRLTVTEIDPEGRNFGVTWSDSESWETSTIISDDGDTTIIMDKNGDGYADFRAEITPSGARRFELQGEEWVEVKSKKKEALLNF